jgi:teichuronic acid biosynthesis glycosyltransferase TuaC
MHVLTLTSLFPNAVQPLHGVFVRTRMEAFVRKFGHYWSVVAPVPYFPRLPFTIKRTYRDFANVPLYEEPRGYPVHHPRYLVLPNREAREKLRALGMRYYGRWMAAGVRNVVREIHERHPIDLIDGHYIYPDGSAAVMLAQELRIPVVLTARGSDLNLYPQRASIVSHIRANLQACNHVICVCEELYRVALQLGTPSTKTSIIGNGIDPELFRGGDMHAARTAVGLPSDATIILSVGHMTDRKGFHLLIEAFAMLKREDMLLVIVGTGPQRAELLRLADRFRLGTRVCFPGGIPNEGLPDWYRAADLFVLASSREGWPNVLCEAQACGLPAVATRAWGIPEIVHNERLGVLIDERSVGALHDGLQAALVRHWDRGYIESVGRSRTWDRVAEEIAPIFEGLFGPLGRRSSK